jgi:hypothetical protein
MLVNCWGQHVASDPNLLSIIVLVIHCVVVLVVILIHPVIFIGCLVVTIVHHVVVLVQHVALGVLDPRAVI